MGVGEGICGGSCGGTKRLRRPEYDGDRRGNGAAAVGESLKISL